MSKILFQIIRHNSYSNQFSQKQFINKINKITKNNINCVEEFNFNIKKPNMNTLELYYTYNASIILQNDSINIQKNLKVIILNKFLK